MQHEMLSILAEPTTMSRFFKNSKWDIWSWRATLRRAGVSYFPIYDLRQHVFCMRLSWVAPDAVVQRAMRHSSPETKRRYQLGLANQVREHLERVNERAAAHESRVADD